MNAWILFVLMASAILSACSGKDGPARTAAAAPTPVTLAPAPNSGQILQLMQAAGYTYAEVKTGAGQTVWMAGGPLQLKVGDRVQWGDFAVMRNFSSKALGRTFEEILFVNVWGAPGGVAAQVAPHGTQTAKAGQDPSAPSLATSQTGQGRVKNVALAGGYTYLEVVPKRSSSSLWLAAPQASVQVGENIAWNGGAVMQNFAAKALGRTFDQIIFVGTIAVLP